MSDLGVGSGKPALVLLHPFLLSGNVWQDVVPLLSSYHQVFTPTLLGHRGGPPVQRRPVTIWDVIDAAEEYLNEHGLQRPHLVGNSAGGFVALELARRGRAAPCSHCAHLPQPKKPSTATAVPSSKTPANSWPAICVLPHRRYFRSEAQIPVATTRADQRVVVLETFTGQWAP